MRFVDFVPGGAATDLHIKDSAKPPLLAGQVLVQVRAFGINRADLLQREGKYPPPPGESPILGLEVAGEIVEIAALHAPHSGRFKLGDPVFGLVPGGGYAEYVAVWPEHLLLLPPSVTMLQGAAMAECYLTAYQSMFVEYALQPQHRVLIHAGASGVGLAAIQLAKQAGCEVSVTASGDEKLAACQTAGADQLINYRQCDFVTAIKPKGVDLIIDFVGADYVNRNLAVLNPDGCIIQLSMLGGRFVEKLDMALLLGKRATLKGSTLRSRTNDYKAQLVKAFEQDCWNRLSSQQLSPVIDQVYHAEEAASAHLKMESNLNIGKLVCHW